MSEEEDSLMQTFMIECEELFEEMENSLLELEGNPNDEDTINALFRAAHTIKGASGVVGFDRVGGFTHKVENVLENVRQGKISITPDLTETLLKSRDHIMNLVEIEFSGSTVDPAVQATEDALLKELLVFLEEESAPSEVAKPEGASSLEKEPASNDVPEGNVVKANHWHISLRFGVDVFRHGMDPSSFINYLPKIGEIINMETLTDALPGADEMDPESCYLGFEINFKTEFDKQAIEDVFEFVLDDCDLRIVPPHAQISEYIDLIKDVPESSTRLGEILVESGALTQAELDEILNSQASDAAPGSGGPKLGELLVDKGIVDPTVVDAAVKKQKGQKEVKKREAKTIRVDTDKLDQLINLVGELVIANANINQHAQRLQDSNFLESTSALSRLVEDIRESAMQVRMVPMGEIFKRFNRVVRDMSRDLGKKIELEINGGETELDKNLIEKINDPLMHLVRNSADHGIESPEKRLENGKSETGKISLNAFQDTGSIIIQIVDNGGGLNKEKITAKAREKGLITEDQTLSDNEIHNLIFEPGFSTAEKVTSVSGRGVGMDVVKRNIQSLRGTVGVESSGPTGSVISIQLPLTLAIIDGFMVGVGDSSYIIPLDMVIECIELSNTDRDVSDKRNYLNLRGEVLPSLRIRDMFFEDGETSEHENIVIVQSGGQKMGLVVDELHGEVQAVIKSLGKVYENVKGISGATILGDGTVALIIDVSSVIQSLTHEEVEVKALEIEEV